MTTQPHEIVNVFADPRNPEEEEETTPVAIVLMSLNARIESAQADFLHHARWAARDLERVIRDAEAGTPSEFHGESNISNMKQAALTVRLLTEARNSVLWAVERT